MIRLLLLLLLCLPAQAATVYKWVDEQGRTHFSTEPPPRGQAAERIAVKRAPKEPARPAKAKPAAGGEFERLEAQAQQAQSKAETAYRRRKCGEARQARLQLETAAAAEAADAQRQTAVKIAERDIRRWCE